MDVGPELRTILQKWTKESVNIEMGTKLADFDLDSLDLAEIVFEIEERFQIEVGESDSNMASISFAELCDLIERQITAKTTRAARGAA